MDTQLVVLPLLDKVEKNTPESAIRKIVFPHVRTHLVDYSTSLTPSLQPFASNTMYTSNHLEAAPMETFLPLSVFLSREAWFVVRRKRGCCSSSSPIIWSCGESGRAMVMVRKTHTHICSGTVAHTRWRSLKVMVKEGVFNRQDKQQCKLF